MSNNNVSSQTVSTTKASLKGANRNATAGDSKQLMEVSKTLISLPSASLSQLKRSVGDLLHSEASTDAIRKIGEEEKKKMIAIIDAHIDGAIKISQLPRGTTATGGGFDKKTAITALFSAESRSSAIAAVKACLKKAGLIN
jgi:hypothetical protein